MHIIGGILTLIKISNLYAALFAVALSAGLLSSPADAKNVWKQCIKNAAGVSFSVDTFDNVTPPAKVGQQNKTFNLGNEICYESEKNNDAKIFVAKPMGCKGIAWATGGAVAVGGAVGFIMLGTANPELMQAAIVMAGASLVVGAVVAGDILKKIDATSITIIPHNMKSGGKGIEITGTCFGLKVNNY